MRRTLTTLIVVLVAATAVSASWARSTDTKLGLVGYAVPREALGAIIKEWQKTPDGSNVSFSQSYGASGDQARAVANGLPADIVQLSTGLDVDYLVEKGLVDRNWEQAVVQGHRLELARRVRGASREPQEDQELGRPGQARASR